MRARHMKLAVALAAALFSTAATTPRWEGVYDAVLDGAEGQITITRAGATYTAQISAFGMETNCNMEFEARGRATGNRLVLDAPHDDGLCRVTLDRQGARLRIASQDCAYFHGGGCYLAGEATRAR